MKVELTPEEFSELVTHHRNGYRFKAVVEKGRIGFQFGDNFFKIGFGKALPEDWLEEWIKASPDKTFWISTNSDYGMEVLKAVAANPAATVLFR